MPGRADLPDSRAGRRLPRPPRRLLRARRADLHRPRSANEAGHPRGGSPGDPPPRLFLTDERPRSSVADRERNRWWGSGATGVATRVPGRRASGLRRRRPAPRNSRTGSVPQAVREPMAAAGCDRERRAAPLPATGSRPVRESAPGVAALDLGRTELRLRQRRRQHGAAVSPVDRRDRRRPPPSAGSPATIAAANAIAGTTTFGCGAIRAPPTRCGGAPRPPRRAPRIP